MTRKWLHELRYISQTLHFFRLASYLWMNERMSFCRTALLWIPARHLEMLRQVAEPLDQIWRMARPLPALINTERVQWEKLSDTGIQKVTSPSCHLLVWLNRHYGEISTGRLCLLCILFIYFWGRLVETWFGAFLHSFGFEWIELIV